MKKKEETNEKEKSKKRQSDLVTKESFSAVCALFSSIALLILFSRSLIFGDIGVAVHAFVMGLFGYLAYPLLLGALYASVTSLIGKRFVKNRKIFFCVWATLLSLALIIHTAVTYFWPQKGYLFKCFYAGEQFPASTVAGWLGGLIVYALSAAASKVGAIIIFSALALFFGYLTFLLVKKQFKKNKAEENEGTEAEDGNLEQGAEQPLATEQQQQAAYASAESPQAPQAQRPVYEQGQAMPQQNANTNANVNASGPVRYTPQQSVPASAQSPYMPPRENSYRPVQVPVQNTFSGVYNDPVFEQSPGVRLGEESANARSASPQSRRVGGAFSPFGTMQNAQGNEPASLENSYEDSRAFLFGASPAENYRRNLIFDPNANVNRRPSVDPAQNPTLNGGYGQSYSEAYQASVNASGANARPAKIYTDRSNESAGNYGTRTETNAYDRYTPSGEESISPMRPIAQPSVEPQTPASYSSYTQSRTNEEYRPLREETPPQSREESVSPRHDYMDLFSPANPNVFGNSEADRGLAEETFGREAAGRGVYDGGISSRDREESFLRDENDSDRDLRSDEEATLRSGMNIFDEETDTREDDPYTLRSSFDAPRDNGRDFESDRRDFNDDSRSSVDARETTGDRFAVEDLSADRGRDFEATESVEPPAPVRETPAKPMPAQQPAPPPPPKPRVIRPYVRVPIDDFDCRDVEPTSNMEEVEETKANIIATLDDFKVTGASIASVTFGPTVTRYNVTIPRNISPKKVVALDQSIAISLHSSGVNIYPNYEDGVVSIEVPNKDRQFVQLGCMLTGDSFVNAKSSSLMFTMGKDVGNRKVYGDISKMIHLLVAGSSGSGKSVFLGSLIVSMIYKYSPEELRLILIDPKKTEFVLYNNLPHLMINEIITDVNKAVQSLNWAIGEMNRRYGLFEQMSRAGTYVVNLDQYNSHLDKTERLPKIVIIIDELADLMLAAKKDIEDRIQNLTQKARAAGIHLIVATQRPSIDVITGVIKSNLPTRIAFAVATEVDSRVILDQTGAQKLLGKGDFLYTMQGINTPVRVQSAFISPEDSQRVVNFIKANNEVYYDESATAFINNARGGNGSGGSGGSGDEIEPVYIDALRYVIAVGNASISMILRKCSVGYNKAGKIVEWMEEMGYISGFEGAKARKVLITQEEFESKYGSM